MSKEITITNANNLHSFVSFRINGLEDSITVGIVPDPNSHGQALSVAYKGDIKIVPLSANTATIKKINEDDKITVPLNMSKETYEWLISPADDDGYIPFGVIPVDEAWQPDQVTELDDEAYDEFEKEVMNPEPDMERVEAAKKIFEDVDKVINDIKIVEIPINAETNPLKNQEEFKDLWKHEQTHYGKLHLLELMDEWGVDGTNYADFRSVIQEHCFNKGLYAFDDIEKVWKVHQESIKNAIKGIKKNG